MRDQNTPHFTINGSTVTASGSTAQGQVDYFYGQANVGYTVVVNSGASLYNMGSNTSYEPPLLTGSGTPYFEVIYISHGTIINNGTLTTYPQPPGNSANNYHKSPAVIFINNLGSSPSQVTNNGVIGDFPGVSNKSNPFYSYSQENDVGVFLYDGTVTNNRGAVISGNNGVFTKGSGTINNYGTILGSNDGALTGYTVNNYANASLSNGVAGFACIHAYNTVNNYGYMLGQDYGILADGRNFVINDYGGAAVAGVTDFDGSQVYNGEISALQRGSELPKTSGPYLTNDAIMLDTNGVTVNLISTTANNVVYLPMIVGPMEGGFNGDYASPNAHVINTLNFNFNGLSASQANALQTAIAHSYRSGPNGVYSSGIVVLNGFTYHWEDFAHVTYQGTVVQGAVVAGPTANATAKATATITAKATATHKETVPTVTKGNVTIASGGTVATVGPAAVKHQDSASLGSTNIGLLLTGLLLLVVLGFTAYRLFRKRLHRWYLAQQPTQEVVLDPRFSEKRTIV